MIRNIVNGFCMALADSVPGVSGGTVAFIMGFYENFIDALNNVFARDKNNMKKSAIYLGKMGIGWIIGILSSILLLSALFEKNIYFMSSLFFGLSLGAIPFILRSQWENIKGKYLFLIDEAHNLVDRGREMYSASLCKEEIESTRRFVRAHSSRLYRMYESIVK